MKGRYVTLIALILLCLIVFLPKECLTWWIENATWQLESSRHNRGYGLISCVVFFFFSIVCFCEKGGEELAIFFLSISIASLLIFLPFESAILTGIILLGVYLYKKGFFKWCSNWIEEGLNWLDTHLSIGK